MSPNEFQLRAALREGEGESPNADSLISQAIDLRQRRSRRITAIVGGSGLAAVLALGITALVANTGNDGGGGSAASANGGALSAPSRAGAASATRSPGADSRSAAGRKLPHAAGLDVLDYATQLRCPQAPVRLMLPGGGGSGQFGSTGPLFSRAVDAMRICGYPIQTGAGPRSQAIGSPEAGQIAASLESAPTMRDSAGCPANVDFIGGTIEIIPVTETPAGPVRLKAVVITLACVSSQATNGTAVRYLDNIPSAALNLVVRQPIASVSRSAPPRANGSPPR